MKIFRSRIGLEILIPIIIVFVFLFYEAIVSKSFIGILVLLLVILFFVYLYFSTWYIISEKVLKIKCGFFFNEKIDITTIKSISEMNDFFSAPTFSMKRLLIKFNDIESVAISPKNKIDFMNKLKEINSSILVELQP